MVFTFAFPVHPMWSVAIRLFMCPFCVDCRTLQVEDLFKEMDTDGSGTIDKDELTVFVKMASAHK